MTKNVLISISLSINPPGQKLLVGSKFPLISFHCRVQALIHINQIISRLNQTNHKVRKRNTSTQNENIRAKKKTKNKMKTNLFALL